MAEKESTGGRFRKVTGLPGLINKVLLICIPVSGILFVLDIHLYLGWSVFREQYLSLFLGLILGSAFLSVPSHKGASREHAPWYDIILAAMGFGICLYSFVMYPEYVLTGPVYMGPETVGDFIKQRRRNYAGHLHLKEKYGYQVSSLESGRVLRLALGEIWGAIRLIWILFALGTIEMVSRVLGWWDYRVRKQKHVVWDIAWTTKQVKRPIDPRGINVTSPHSPARKE